jgi:type II secretory pathway predicted ATPase ExeA/cell division septation protein DedD
MLDASRPQTDTLIYEPFFGLDEKAFSLNADSRFVYSSPSYGATRSGLLAGIRRREGMHVLTGEIGTGKTTLCQDVLRDLGRKTYSAIVPDPFASREDLLKTLLIDFGVLSIQELTGGRLRQASRTELGYLLSEFLDSLVHDAFVVVIIDEAQNLALPLIEETRILSDTFGATGRLQIVFVGQPELHGKLKLPEMRQVDQRVCGYHRLAPMSLDGVAGYIQHRLHVAGCRRDRVLFPEEIVKHLHLRCGGVPRLINRICDRALHLAYERRAEEVDRETLDAALLEIGAATLSPTWDSILFAESPARPLAGATAAAAPSPAPTVPAAAPAPEAATAVTVAHVAPDVDMFAPSDEEDFNQQIDHWVSKDLAPPTRTPSMLWRDEVSPGPKRRRLPPPSARTETQPRTVTTDWPRHIRAESRGRTWAKRIASTVAALIALIIGAAAIEAWTDLQAAPMLPPVAARPATAEPKAPVEAPVVEALPAGVPATAAPVIAMPPIDAAVVAPAADEFLVAVGLFSSRERADQLVDMLSQADLPALQRPFQLRRQEVQQIVLGPYFSRADAAADLRRLQALGGYADASVIDSGRQP